MSQPSTSSATRVRYGVLALTVSMSVLLYLDRNCISVAADRMRDDLGLSKRDQGNIYSAFFFAYALSQVPAGWLGDRLGARKMLALCVVGWSLLTGLTALAVGLVSLLLVRLVFGVAQAGAYPIAARVNSLWMPFGQRAFASGLITLGGRAGGALAPWLTGAIIAGSGGDWRLVFWLFALPGLAWTALFWWWFRDRPGEHPGCNSAEVALIAPPLSVGSNTQASAGALPWAEACRSLGLWMQCLTQFATNIAWVFLVTWLPTYLKETYRIDLQEAGMLSSLPLLAGMAGCFLGGAATDWLTKRLGLRWGRGLMGMTTKVIAAAGVILAMLANDPYQVVLAFSLASFGVDLGLGATWAYFQDAGGPYVGTFLGWANMFGNLGATLSPVLLGELAVATGSWQVPLGTCAVCYVISGLCWFGIDARKPIVRSHEA